MRWHRLWYMLAAVLFALLAFAWFDGGREPLRTIVQPVPVPEAA